MNSRSRYVSRAGLKLQSACSKFKVDFKGCSILDVGSSTGGFSDYALKNGASRVIAVELGTNQLADSLRQDSRLELHEKTNILDVQPAGSKNKGLKLSYVPDIILVDLSFVSLKTILPHLYRLASKNTKLIVLVKPQFEVGPKDKHAGLIKNETIRRKILRNFEKSARDYFVIINKVDSSLTGSKGNKERFYLLVKNISSKTKET